MSRHLFCSKRFGIGSAILFASVLCVTIFSKDMLARGLFDLYGECYHWIPSLVALHVVSDTAVGLAYLFISIMCFTSVRLLHLPCQSLFLVLGICIICCAVTHTVEVITTLFIPIYWFAGSLKLLTAIVGIWIALLLPLLISKACDTRSQGHEITYLDEQYTALANAMPLLILVGNVHGNIEFSNTMCQNYTGYSPEELIVNAQQGALLHPDDYQQLRASWLLQRQQGITFEDEARMKRYDGTFHWHLVRNVPLREHDGTIKGWISTATDIDKQKRNEQALCEAQQRQDTFLTMVSHELKTPLTSLQLLISFLRHDITDEKYERAFTTIGNQLQRIIQLVNDLLDMSRIKANQLSLACVSCDAIQLAHETITRMQTNCVSHRFIVACDGAAQIYADPDRIEQVIFNLLTNAIKYSPDADHIDIRMTADAHDFLFAVQDYGIGMSQEAQTHIFEQYYRNIEASHQKYAGLGIGLYTASKIVKCHHGEIWVVSDEGQGSTFTFSLPLEYRGA